MVRIWLLLMIVSAGVLFRPSLVSAHDLATDGTIGAVMHIDPEDDPIIGQPANFYFDFNAGQKNIMLSQCDCQAVIRLGSTVVFTKKIFYSVLRPTIPGFTYTFTKPGDYRLEVTGQPVIAGAWQVFHLHYGIPVSRYPGTPATVSHSHHGWLHYVQDYGFVVAFAVWFLTLLAKGKLTFQQKNTSEQLGSHP